MIRFRASHRGAGRLERPNWSICQVAEARPGHARLWVTANDYEKTSRVLELDNPTPEMLCLNEPPGP